MAETVQLAESILDVWIDPRIAPIFACLGAGSDNLREGSIGSHRESPLPYRLGQRFGQSEPVERQNCPVFRFDPEGVRIVSRIGHRENAVGISAHKQVEVDSHFTAYLELRAALQWPIAHKTAPVATSAAGVHYLSKSQGPRMTRRRKIYEGKAKILYEGPEPGTLIQYFKDDATAFNAQKKGTIAGKGVINNRVSEHVFTRLSHIGIPTHFIRRLNMREQLIRQVEIVPIEVIVRNVAAGTLSKRLGIEEGTPLPHTLLEYCYKDDSLGDPLVAEEHIACFGWASQEEMQDISSMAIRINDFMCGMFAAIGIRLIDFKLEFGRLFDGDFSRIILADEISPDGCRLWDIETGEKLDKDRFRRDLGGEAEAYQEVARRLGLMPEETEGAVLDMVSHRLRKGK
jgi:phosphoribosylaminoimidazole-succinocarboxamide synthase